MAEQVDFTFKEILATQIRMAQKNDIMQEVHDGHYRLIYTTNETFFDMSRKQPREVLLKMHKKESLPSGTGRSTFNCMFEIFQVIEFSVYMHSCT